MIVAIDGPAGTGKGTIASLIAERMGFTNIDTGAMYRCVALKMLNENIAMEDIDKIKQLLENIKIEFISINNRPCVFLDDEDVTDEIRTPRVNEVVSPVSAIKEIRIKMVELQRKLGEGANVVMEGRDITTVVFPNADVKIYLTADAEVRAMRRFKELEDKGIKTTFEETLEQINKRDDNDRNKEMGALKIAKDAIIVDSTNMTVEEVFSRIKEIIDNKDMEADIENEEYADIEIKGGSEE